MAKKKGLKKKQVIISKVRGQPDEVQIAEVEQQGQPVVTRAIKTSPTRQPKIKQKFTPISQRFKKLM